MCSLIWPCEWQKCWAVPYPSRLVPPCGVSRTPSREGETPRLAQMPIMSPELLPLVTAAILYNAPIVRSGGWWAAEFSTMQLIGYALVFISSPSPPPPLAVFIINSAYNWR